MALAVLTLSSAAITAVLSGLRALASRVVVMGTVVLSIALIQIPPLAATIAASVLAGFDGMRGRRSGWSGNPQTPVTVTPSEAHSAS